jgi:hypothetical protein
MFDDNKTDRWTGTENTLDGYGHRLKAQKYLLTVSATDSTGVSYSANREFTPDLAKSIKPSTSTKLYSVTSSLEGYSGQYAYVWLSRADGSRIANTYADSNGRFLLQIQDYLLSIGETVYVSALEQGKDDSDPLSIVVAEPLDFPKPSVTGSVYEDGGILNGSTSFYAKIRVTRLDGTHVAQTSAEYNGQFAIQLSDKFIVGEQLLLYAHNSNNAQSQPVFVSILPSLGLTGTPTVTGEVYDYGSSTIYGMAEPNSTVILSRLSGNIVDSVKTSMWGEYSISLSKYEGSLLVAGEQLVVTADSTGKLASKPVTITVKARPLTETPTVTGAVYEDGAYLKGRTTPYSYIELSNVYYSGTVSTTTSSYDGSFTIGFNGGLLTVGQQLKIVAEATNLKPSVPVILTVQPISGKTIKPTVGGTVYENYDSDLYGIAEPYSSVSLYKENGAFLGDSTSDGTGFFSFTYMLWAGYHQFKEGEVLHLRADAPGLTQSDPVVINVKPTPRTVAPTGVTAQVYEDGGVISGTFNPPGYGVELTLRRTNGEVISNSTNYEYSRFTMVVLSNKFTPGEQLFLTAKRVRLRESEPVVMTVLPAQGTMTGIPTVTGNVYDEISSVIQGVTVPNAWMKLLKEDGSILEEARADMYGNYSLYTYVSDKLLAGQMLKLTAKSYGKIESAPVILTVKSYR